MLGLYAVVDTFSNDSSRLTVSISRPWPSSLACSGWGKANCFRPGDGEGSPPSEESETEWKEDIEDAAPCPNPGLREGRGIAIPNFENGGYVW